MATAFWLTLLGVALAAPHAALSAQDAAQWPEALAQQGFKPSRLAFPRPPVFSSQSPPLPIILEGIDLRQAGALLTEDTALIAEGVPLDVTMYWRPAGGLPKDGAWTIRVQGTGPAFQTAWPLDIEDWQIGGLRETRRPLPLPRLRYNGRAVLTLRYTTDSDETEHVLYAAPVHIIPVGAPSPLDDAELDAFFPFAFVRLGKAFRLGPEASLTLSVPEEARERFSRIGIVSATAYDVHFRQGQEICRLDFLDGSGRTTASVTLRAGLTTAKMDHEEYPPGALAAGQITVFSSRPADRPSRFDGEPYNINAYGAVMPLGAAGVETLRVVNLVDAGLIEIRDIVFELADNR